MSAFTAAAYNKKRFRLESKNSSDDQQSMESGRDDGDERSDPGRRPSCRQDTRRKLRCHLQTKRPGEMAIEHETVNTPIHRLLERLQKTPLQPAQAAESLRRLLDDLDAAGFLNSYINISNRDGKTPLSISMEQDHQSSLIPILVSRGAQLNHRCGSGQDTGNHVHFAMTYCSPGTIHQTLNEVFSSYPSGSNIMYALNQRGQTPKAALISRLELADFREPLSKQELASVLDRIPAYPPVSGHFVQLELTEIPSVSDDACCNGRYIRSHN